MNAKAVDTLAVLRRFAPGTDLRDAVELILRQGTGGLILFGAGSSIDEVCSGGFFLQDVSFTAQRVAELAKMDGGIVVDEAATAIRRANVHFIPDPTLATKETGTRFRTAERLAAQTGAPVLAVSEEGTSLASVFLGGSRYELRRPTDLQAEANQMLNSLERLRRRLADAEDHLTRNEVDDLVTVRDVVLLLQRAALIRRLDERVERTVVELGGEGKLLSIQAADLVEGVGELATLVYADYSKRRGRPANPVLDRLGQFVTDDLYDMSAVVNALGLDPLDTSVRPRGWRALSRVPRLPETVKESLIGHFRDFQKLLHADVAQLDKVEGVGQARARQLRSYLDRLLEVGSIWGVIAD
ncbi:MAG TPA: DNA integrity scanning diadenylate cyclase DisA [Acidimicrobiia bacterium]|jgi:diadenylate cyclase